jgi:hypothetical protein
LGTSLSGYENDEIYALLQERNYLWNSRTQTWEQKVIKPSVFDNADEGYVRIRIMASPERIDEVMYVVSGYFPEVLEVSGQYPNREDVGVRVYLLVKLGN